MDIIIEITLLEIIPPTRRIIAEIINDFRAISAAGSPAAAAVPFFRASGSLVQNQTMPPRLTASLTIKAMIVWYRPWFISIDAMNAIREKTEKINANVP